MRRRLALVATALLFLASCKGSQGPGPIPPPPGPPQIACGAPVSLENVTGFSQPVTYPLPTTSAGAQPVSVTCTPPSGSAFSLGETPVTCTASDAFGRQASCAFSVTLRHRTLVVTRILAYGDSLTEGENGRPLNFMPVVDVPNSYPTALRNLFAERIPLQQLTVVNAGRGGEMVSQNEDRLKERLASVQPQVLLLLQGMNDVIGRVSVSLIAEGVADSIRRARDRGVQYVFVATLPPQARENCQPSVVPCRADTVSASLLAEVNQRIRSVVPGNGAHLVELHDRLLPDRLTYVDIDGLHMRPEGYRAIATLFWDRIVEVVPAPQLSGLPGVPDR